MSEDFRPPRDDGSPSDVATVGLTRQEDILTTEIVFETLSNSRRRYALHYLMMEDNPATLRDLSEQIAAWENGIKRSEVTPKQRKRAYTALHQVHLPKMNRSSVVDYDCDRKIITSGNTLDAFDIYFDITTKDELPWSQFYLGLGATLTGIVAVGSAGLMPFSWVSGFTYAIGVAVVFSTVAAYHTIRDRQQRLGSRSDTLIADICAPPTDGDKPDK